MNKQWPCSFKNKMSNCVNFHYSTQMSETLYFDRLFLSKAYNVSARKFQRNYVPWHWKQMQNLTRSLKNDIRNLVNFHARKRKSENLHFDGILFSKAYKLLDEKVQKSYVSSQCWCKIDAKFEEKLTLGSKTYMRNLVNFYANSSKSESSHSDVLILSKVYYVWAKKVQRSYES